MNVKLFLVRFLVALGILLGLSSCASNEATPALETKAPQTTVLPTETSLPLQPEKSMNSGTPSDAAATEVFVAEDELPLRAKDGMPQLLIPAGPFMMGCDPENNGGVDCMPDILPLHEVSLSAYYIDQFEVSNSQYRLCIEAAACTEPKSTGLENRPGYFTDQAFADHPVVAVSWEQADAYCRWVGGRLPTEAEWVKAARGEDLRPFPWGFAVPDCSLANFNSPLEGRCSEGTTAAGSYPDGASPYGVMDMAGNVWEWTNDWYDWTYYQRSPSQDPMGPESGYQKIVKGGAWDYSLSVLTISYNSDHQVQEFKQSFGFRCALPETP